MLSTAPYGGADISEIDRIGRQLKSCVGDDDAWFRAWTAGGDLMRQRAAAAEDARHHFTAASLYLRACAQYQHAEHFRHPKDAAAMDTFRRSLECFEKFMALTDRPRIEKVEIRVQARQAPRVLRSRRVEDRRACALRRPLRRFRHAERASVPQRRRRSCAPWLLRPAGRWTGHGRVDPLPQYPPASRLRARGQRVSRLPCHASGHRQRAHRGRRAEPRRLLRAALCRARSPLRRVHRVGRAVGRARSMGEEDRGDEGRANRSRCRFPPIT